MELTETLSKAEQSLLQEAEAIIDRGRGAFVEVGNALLEIRDRRLYRATEHRTFDDYCKKRWGFSRVHAHRLIESAAVTKNLLPIGNTPATESQARPLTKLEPFQQPEAWRAAINKASSDGRRVTARDVEEVVAEIVDDDPPRVKTADEELSEEHVTWTDAFCVTRQAVDRLRLINPLHPDKIKALESVIAWCESNKNRKNGWSKYEAGT